MKKKNVFLLLFSIVLVSVQIARAETWTLRTSAADNAWRSIAYRNNLYVAVGSTGTGNRVMTSPDGITWTARTSAADNEWFGVAHNGLSGPGSLFVAVSRNSTNQVMTSPDGITWTARTAVGSGWQSVVYGDSIWVAVGNSGLAMTSTDGINWASRSTYSNPPQWTAVAHNGLTGTSSLFVAVGETNTNRVMTSPDGITWTARTSASETALWRDVHYANNLWVAVASDNTNTNVTDRVMTSTDGISWTSRAGSTPSTPWINVAFGNGVWVATSWQNVMSSTDGINWTSTNEVISNCGWRGLTYGGDRFVAVASGCSGTRAMTGDFPTSALPVELIGIQVHCLNEGNNTEITWQTASELNADKFIIERSRDGAVWQEKGTIQAAGTTNQFSNYSFTDADVRDASVLYYRLSQVDFDGSTTTYPPVSSNCETKEEIVLFPNPGRDQLYMQLTHHQAEQIQVEIRNPLGAVISSQNCSLVQGLNLLRVNTNDLESGQYFVALVFDSATTEIRKFVKID